MKKSVILLIVIIFLSGCIHKARYEIGLQRVKIGKYANKGSIKPKVINFEDKSLKKFDFSNKLIDIKWWIDNYEFRFILKNKTSKSIKILWEKAAYVDKKGFSHKITHYNRNNLKHYEFSNQPVVVASGSKFKSYIIPKENIYFDESKKEWIKKPLLVYRANLKEELKVIAQKNIGKTIKILLPLQISDSIDEYLFTFQVKNYRIK